MRQITLGHSPRHVVIDKQTHRAFLANDDGSISVLDTSSGMLVNTIGGLGGRALAVDERVGRVVVVGYERAYLLDAHSGAIQRAITLEGTLPQAGGDRSIAVDEQTGQAYIVRTSARLQGQVDVVDDRTGQLRGRLPAGWYPSAISVDGETRRAFIINGGGRIAVSDPWQWMPTILRRLPFIPPPSPTRIVGASVTVLDTAP